MLPAMLSDLHFPLRAPGSSAALPWSLILYLLIYLSGWAPKNLYGKGNFLVVQLPDQVGSVSVAPG
jgi:hypothetical protein